MRKREKNVLMYQGKVTRRNEKDPTEYWKVSATIKFQDKEEYKQMFREIMDVVKKHNRKWEQN